jgi:hypothetical protein
MMSFTDSETTALRKRGFTVDNGLATITSGEITIAVLNGREGGYLQMILKLPNGIEIFCRASVGEIMGEVL